MFPDRLISAGDGLDSVLLAATYAADLTILDSQLSRLQ